MPCCILTVSFINAIIHIKIVILTCFWDNIAYHISLKNKYDYSSVKGRGRKNNFIHLQRMTFKSFYVI